MSCILTKRLYFHVNIFDEIKVLQAGFRDGYSTTNNAFVLQVIVNKQLSKRGYYMWSMWIS